MIPKFRAWHKPNKIMLDLIAINFSLMQITADIENRKIYPELDYCWKETDIPFSEIVLMQYTGLKDKNGVEIFEGDIVKVTDLDERTNCTDCGIGYVEYLDVFGFYNITEIENSIHELAFQDHTIEIIGNIYENPELLEVEK